MLDTMLAVALSAICQAATVGIAFLLFVYPLLFPVQPGVAGLLRPLAYA